MYHLACVNCGATYPADEIIYNCKKCGHLLAVKYPLDTLSVKRETWNSRPLSVWRYKELLPVTIPPVTLHPAAERAAASLPAVSASSPEISGWAWRSLYRASSEGRSALISSRILSGSTVLRWTGNGL